MPGGRGGTEEELSEPAGRGAAGAAGPQPRTQALGGMGDSWFRAERPREAGNRTLDAGSREHCSPQLLRPELGVNPAGQGEGAEPIPSPAQEEAPGLRDESRAASTAREVRLLQTPPSGRSLSPTSNQF